MNEGKYGIVLTVREGGAFWLEKKGPWEDPLMVKKRVTVLTGQVIELGDGISITTRGPR